MSDVGEQLSNEQIDTFICTLGTQQKHGKETFIKVDYQYPLNFAEQAKKLEIPHFMLLTSTGANSNSMFFYMKTKGQVEDAVRSLGLPHLSIFRPALLLNRRNDSRVGEKLASFIPFIDKIESKAVG